MLGVAEKLIEREACELGFSMVGNFFEHKANEARMTQEVRTHRDEFRKSRFEIVNFGIY